MATGTLPNQSVVPVGGQLELLPGSRRGGRRPGAGRKRGAGRRSCVGHESRGRVTRHDVVHVTMRLVDRLPSLRGVEEIGVVVGVLRACAGRHGMRVTDWSVQGNHLHLVAEADDTGSLSRGMQGLTVRLARNLNRGWGRRGTVFADRYHARVLRSPREVHSVLQYVLHNARNHRLRLGHQVDPLWLDPCSSARAFDGWRDQRATRTPAEVGCAAPRSWLRRVGWRRGALYSSVKS